MESNESTESTELIRLQMEETKLQLAEKLETLEQQVADTVQATEAAVSATVESVHDTVESVSGAVQSAVSSLSDACDIRRHYREHPVLVLGGAAIVGFMVGRFMVPRRSSVARDGQASMDPRIPAGLDERAASSAVPCAAGDGCPVGNNGRTDSSAALTAAYDSGFRDSVWASLEGIALAAAGKVVQEMTSRAVPFLMNRLFEEPAGRTETHRQADDATSAPPLRAAHFE